MKSILLGALLIIIGLWGGAFAMDYFTKEAYELATLITALFCGIAGCYLIISKIDV